jgi:hypothetical protein
MKLALVGSIIFVLALNASKVFAASFEPEEVEIKLLIEDSEDPVVRAEWIKACQRLGDMLQVYSGPWGYGVFKTYSCYLKEKLVAGSKTGTTSWQILVDALKPEIEFHINHIVKGGRVIQESKSWIPNHLQFLKIIQDKKVAEVLALDLLNNLPFARVLKSAEIEKKKFKLDDEIKSNDLTPPDGFMIYKLTYSEKYNKWIPNLAGEARLAGPAKNTKTGHSYEYKIEITQPMELTASYWLQAKDGRGQNQDKITRVMDQNLKRYGLSIFDFQDMLLDTLAAGYTGVRYGYPMAKGDPLISQVPLIGVFAEVRGGPVSGLRWYWDFTPEVEVETQGKISSLKWSRFTFGWSFGLEFENALINRIDVVPKVGLLDFDGIFVVQTELDYIPVEFRLKNQTNLGVETGIETTAPWFLVRLWGSYDKSGMLGNDGQYVTFLRGGIDTYWDLFNLGRTFEFSLLIFGVGERLAVARDEIELADEATSVSGLNYNQAFLGLGLTATW